MAKKSVSPDVSRQCVIDAVTKVVDDYLAQGDSARENASMGWGPNGLLFTVGSEFLKIDYLNRMRQAGHGELVDLHELGAVHIHDLGLGHKTPYCCGHSLPNLLADGVKGGSVTAGPAKHLRSAINQMVNFIGAGSNEYAGAQAFSDVDVYLAPYVFKAVQDEKKYHGFTDAQAERRATREVYQTMQELMFHLNYNNRWGGQSPFSNISLALDCPDDLRDTVALVAGKPLNEHDLPDVTQPLTYGQLEKWQRLVAKAILAVFLAGDHVGRGFTFPVLSINATKEFFSNPLRYDVYRLAAKYGTPYFQNYINGHSNGQKLDPRDIRAMCCRLQIDMRELSKHTGGLFGNGDSTGSLQVVTPSLPMLAMEAMMGDTGLEHVISTLPKNEEKAREARFFARLGYVMELIKNEQLWKRQHIESSLGEGFYALSQAHFKKYGFKTFFTTIGHVGLWECVEILTGDAESFATADGLALAERIMRFMADRCAEFTQETGFGFNFEATPAESASYRLAKLAIARYPSIVHRGTREAPYFTNSCHLPVERADDVELLLWTQNRLQPICSGGTVLHVYTDEELTVQSIEGAVKALCATEIPYFSFTPVYSHCACCGKIVPGAHEFCPNQHTPEQIEAYRKLHPTMVVDQ